MEAGEPLPETPPGPSESAGFLADGTWQTTPARQEKVDLPGGLRAPQSARRAIEEHFSSHLDAGVLASVELLTTELVSNAVRHGGAGEGSIVVLHLALAPGRLRVEVCDEGRGFEPHRPTPYGEGGYGLFLVSEVATIWGVSHDGGTRTWFEFALPASAVG